MYAGHTTCCHVLYSLKLFITCVAKGFRDVVFTECVCAGSVYIWYNTMKYFHCFYFAAHTGF